MASDSNHGNIIITPLSADYWLHVMWFISKQTDMGSVNQCMMMVVVVVSGGGGGGDGDVAGN